MIDNGWQWSNEYFPIFLTFENGDHLLHDHRTYGSNGRSQGLGVLSGEPTISRVHVWFILHDPLHG